MNVRYLISLSLVTATWTTGAAAAKPGGDVATPASDTSHTLLVQAELPTGRLADALAREDRPAADKARDAERRPTEVVRFLGLTSGMTVLDLFAAGGYYTEVLSAVVGPEGKVYAHNNEFLLTVRGGVNDRQMSERLAGDRLPNVERLDRELAELGLEPGSVDAIMFVLNFHDVYAFTQRSGGSMQPVLGLLHRILEPGGVLGLIDHAARPGPFDPQLHRIDPAVVKAEMEQAGFVLEAESELLQNADDDRSRNVFAAGTRGATDRFLLRYRKPPDRT